MPISWPTPKSGYLQTSFVSDGNLCLLSTHSSRRLHKRFWNSDASATARQGTNPGAARRLDTCPRTRKEGDGVEPCLGGLSVAGSSASRTAAILLPARLLQVALNTSLDLF
ncbi:hypothetical protein SELMODRAFT_417141 [Selaginella moellendorffii]|uniref:Uncharacterized protein n=1 Tax=Selaginella moellendorffii TaxID=88036 RepID=D8S1H9_SELML|nr:hypothetical protein SELMODRAFT_417141 [Selaginella moellendorffii]